MRTDSGSDPSPESRASKNARRKTLLAPCSRGVDMACQPWQPWPQRWTTRDRCTTPAYCKAETTYCAYFLGPRISYSTPCRVFLVSKIQTIKNLACLPLGHYHADTFQNPQHETTDKSNRHKITPIPDGKPTGTKWPKEKSRTQFPFSLHRFPGWPQSVPHLNELGRNGDKLELSRPATPKFGDGARPSSVRIRNASYFFQVGK